MEEKKHSVEQMGSHRENSGPGVPHLSCLNSETNIFFSKRPFYAQKCDFTDISLERPLI